VGQKVHPFGFRLGFNKTWRSRWYSDRDYAKLLHEDIALRSTLKKRFAHAGVSKIETERAVNRLKIDIYTSRPGIIIGRKGTEVDKLKQEIQKRTGRDVFINIQEIQKPELDAQLISESVALQLEKRVAFRRAMRKAVESALRFGARGIKVRVSGRLNGAEIARSEWYLHGQLPLQTLRADIDYGFAEASTTYGQIGIKVWLYKGERLVPLRGREEEGMARFRRVVRRFRAEGPRAVLAHRSADRGGARRDDPVHQARRQDLGAGVPRQADYQEAPGNADGQGQGRARSVGRRGPARTRAVRDAGRERNRSAGSDEAGGGEAADHDQVRHPLCPGEDAMKAAALRDLGADELGARERELTDQLFRLRIQKSMGQLEAPNKMRSVRRDLARVKTVLRQKRT
jgi:small subunit ribosomal protein S3